MTLSEILSAVRDGQLSPAQAEQMLGSFETEELGFARLDHGRKNRTGFAEVIFCQNKTAEQVAAIFSRFSAHDDAAFGTRADPVQFAAVKAAVPDAEYHELARIIYLNKNKIPLTGTIAVVTGGTADLPVAEEAALTAEFFGARANRFFDVGISGIHRLFHVIDDIRQCDVIIAVAGMEGALPSVIAGLVDKPVIAVPTSVGYGAHFAGLAPLLTMLNSCAEGITVVNIDNGFGAGYSAAQISRLIQKGANQ
jgi:NCAIR mutase (PurE)-related protein